MEKVGVKTEEDLVEDRALGALPPARPVAYIGVCPKCQAPISPPPSDRTYVSCTNCGTAPFER